MSDSAIKSSSPDPRLQQAEILEALAGISSIRRSPRIDALLAGASALRSAVSVIAELEKVIEYDGVRRGAGYSPELRLASILSQIDQRIAALRSTET